MFFSSDYETRRSDGIPGCNQRSPTPGFDVFLWLLQGHWDFSPPILEHGGDVRGRFLTMI